MLFRKLFCLLVLLSFLREIKAQTPLPMARNLLVAYKNQTRTTDGKPGKNYWQNTANYDLKINFDPVTRLLIGTASIDYFNNSPDTLTQVLFKLYPNLYKRSSPRLMNIDSADLTNGVSIEQFSINGDPAKPEQRRVNGTNMTVTIPALSPGQQMRFTINYS